MQMCLAIMAEVEERLLRMDDFEDIVTCLKMDPATWSDDKLRGLLTAAYLSSVSEDEIQLACRSVTAESLHAIRPSDDNIQSGTGQPVPEAGIHQAPGVPDVGACKLPSSHHEGLESMQSLGGIDDLMKHELEQLTWAGPSAGEEGATDALQLDASQHTLVRRSGDAAALLHNAEGCAHDATTADASVAAVPIDGGQSQTSDASRSPKDVTSRSPAEADNVAGAVGESGGQSDVVT